MSRNAPSLTGLRATAGHSVLSLGGLFKAEVAMMPMFDVPEQARPTRNNICKEHKVQLKQAWHCPECKKAPAATTKAVHVGTVFVEAPDTEWNDLAVETDPTLALAAWVPTIDSIYFSGSSYFLFPGERKELDAFLIIMEVLKRKRGYLLATTAGDHGTARVLAVSYHEPTGCVIAQACHHTQYLRMEKATRITEGVGKFDAPKAEHIALAEKAFGELPETFTLEVVRDTLGDAQWKYVNDKARAQGIRVLETEQDLEDALRASQEMLQPARTPKKKSSTRKKVTT